MNLAHKKKLFLLYQKKFAFSLLILLSLSALILLATWPWPLYFFHGFAKHWDPPLHIWKLSWNIKHILEGKVFLPAFNANSFYPHAYTFCFHDLYWIPSYLSSLADIVWPNKIFVYNITFLLMWAISGFIMYLLLRDLKLSKPAAYFGAVAFCLAPYRTSYYMEFNMQLCFGLPLIFLFLLRFLKKPTIGNSLGLALSFWAQAVSALYYAVIMASILPFLILPWWNTIAKNLKTKEFYLYLAVVFVVGCGLGSLYLWPYVLLEHYSNLYRAGREIMLHAAQPLAYFLTHRHGKVFLGHIAVTPPENVIFPGFTLLSLAIFYLWIKRDDVKEKNYNASKTVFWIMLLVLSAFFASYIFFAYNQYYMHFHATWFLNIILFFLVFLSLLFSILKNKENDQKCFLTGLGSASIVAFILSLGPVIKTGYIHSLGFNALYLLFYHYSYILKSMRVVSRYSIIILIFFIVASSYAVHEMNQKKEYTKWPVIPLIIFVFWGSHTTRYRYCIQKCNLLSPHLAKIIDSHPIHSLIVLPIGDRNDDGKYMMGIAGSKYLLVNGWDAFYPRYTKDLARFFSQGDLTNALTLLRKFWPSPYILLDTKRLAYLAKRHYGTSEMKISHLCRFLGRDKLFSLYDPQRKLFTGNVYERYVRLDFVDHAKSVVFDIRCHHPVKKVIKDFMLRLNGHFLKSLSLKNRWATVRVAIDHTIPLIPSKNVFSVKSKDTFDIRNFRLEFPKGTSFL